MYVRLGPRERAQHGKLEEDSSDADAGYSVCQAQLLSDLTDFEKAEPFDGEGAYAERQTGVIRCID